MGLTIGLASMLVEGSGSKGLLAVLADEVFGMPLLTQGVDAFALDGPIASRTSGAERVVEAVIAVGSSFLLEEGTTGEWSQALPTDEVVEMPLAVECGDALASDGLVTMSTTGAEELLVAPLTVRDPILLVEVAGAEGHLAVAAHEVFGMVGPVEGLNDLAEDGFAAVSTVPTRGWATIEAARGGAVDVAEHVI